MFGNDKMAPAAAAAGLVVLAALVGCGRGPSVASKSAAAFQEAQNKGETVGGSGHSHGHGAANPGEEHEMPDAAPGADAGHDEHANHGAEHGSAEGSADDHSAMGHGGGHHAAGHAPQEAAGGHHGSHGAHGGMAHGQSPAAPGGNDEHAGHAGHSASPEGVPDTPAPLAEVPSPGQPASTLRPGALDSPAATSVADAQRSAEMAQGMAGGGHGGGHDGHGGTGTYRHVDAGRGPEAFQDSDQHQHQHQGPATSAPATQAGEHSHGASGSASASGAPETTAAVYVCPMHSEVTSNTPGTCPRCGMALAPRGDEE